jgi:hypothetical protein
VPEWAVGAHYGQGDEAMPERSEDGSQVAGCVLQRASNGEILVNHFLKAIILCAFLWIGSPVLAGYLALEDIQTVGDGNFSYNGCFDQTTVTSGNCSLSYSDAAYSFLANVSSFGDSSGLHAQASASISSISGGYIIAEGQVRLTDTLNFNVATPFTTTGYVSMTFTTDGSASGGNTPGFIPNSPPGVGYGLSSLNLNSSHSCSFYNSGSCTVTLGVDFYNNLTINAILSANAFPSVLGGSDSEFANFQNTGFISSLQFTDSNGNPLALNYTSSDGLANPMPQAVNGIPEPSSFALSLVGLGALGFAVTRQPFSRRFCAST